MQGVYFQCKILFLCRLSMSTNSVNYVSQPNFPLLLMKSFAIQLSLVIIVCESLLSVPIL